MKCQKDFGVENYRCMCYHPIILASKNEILKDLIMFESVNKECKLRIFEQREHQKIPRNSGNSSNGHSGGGNGQAAIGWRGVQQLNVKNVKFDVSKSKCYNYHLGHQKRDCKETKQNLDFTCFKCGPPGHVALNCDKDQLPESKV